MHITHKYITQTEEGVDMERQSCFSLFLCLYLCTNSAFSMFSHFPAFNSSSPCLFLLLSALLGSWTRWFSKHCSQICQTHHIQMHCCSVLHCRNTATSVHVQYQVGASWRHFYVHTQMVCVSKLEFSLFFYLLLYYFFTQDSYMWLSDRRHPWLLCSWLPRKMSDFTLTRLTAFLFFSRWLFSWNACFQHQTLV